MTLYLTDQTDPAEIDKALKSQCVYACKLYPAGATTNSDSGVTDIRRIDDVLARMSDAGMPLLVHGEVTARQVDVFDRESRFIDEVLAPTLARFPKLRVVFEHITTARAAEFVERARDGVAATITPQHLLHNRNAIFEGGIRPHYYCLPILKTEPDREALLAAATSGNPRFFLGHRQRAACATHQGERLRLRRHVLRARGHRAVRRSFRGRGQARQAGRVRVRFRRGFLRTAAQFRRASGSRKREWRPPASYPMGRSDKDGRLVPMRANEAIHWQLVG